LAEPVAGLRAVHACFLDVPTEFDSVPADYSFHVSASGGVVLIEKQGCDPVQTGLAPNPGKPARIQAAKSLNNVVAGLASGGPASESAGYLDTVDKAEQKGIALVARVAVSWKPNIR